MFQSHEQLWQAIAETLTKAVQQIIEFAKMIPGFMDLSQDDQIMLLKAGNLTIFHTMIFLVGRVGIWAPSHWDLKK